MDKEPDHAGVPVRGVWIPMHRRWRIEGLAEHNGIAGKANDGVLLGVVHVLVHIDEHVVATGVIQQVLHGVIPIRASVVGGRGSRVARPSQSGLSRVSPSAPVLLEVTASTVGYFV